MRDIVLTTFILGSLPFILRRPSLGGLMWVFVSVMNPHRLSWGFAYEMPFAQLIAIATLLGMVFSRDPKRVPVTPVTVTLFLLLVWVSVTTLFALNPVPAAQMWERVAKIYFMVFITMSVLYSKRHIQALIWIVAFSVAYYGMKGGIFTLIGGGAYRVYGPEGSFIEENNALALATVMTIPLLWYLRSLVTNRWLRLGFIGMMIVCGFSALGSHSRGALLAIGGMLGMFWLKSRAKVVTGFAFVLLVPLAIGFMPADWEHRMKTIETYEEDASAMGRINTWMMAINLAKDRPIVGGGFDLYTASVFARYAPNPLDLHSAHSIYFQMLGEHGYPGLVLFLLLWVLVWRHASWIIRRSRDRPEFVWAADMAKMIQVSVIAYAVGGAFLNLGYYDVPYYLAVAVVLTKALLEKELGAEKPNGWRKAEAPAVVSGAGHDARVPAPRSRQGAGPAPLAPGQSAHRR